MNCEICGSEDAHLRYVNESYGAGENMLVIEKIPMVSCPNCRESYFKATTLHEIDRIKKLQGAIAEKRIVNVASYTIATSA